jgi:hypothetical protein
VDGVSANRISCDLGSPLFNIRLPVKSDATILKKWYSPTMKKAPKRCFLHWDPTDTDWRNVLHGAISLRDEDDAWNTMYIDQWGPGFTLGEIKDSIVSDQHPSWVYASIHPSWVYASIWRLCAAFAKPNGGHRNQPLGSWVLDTKLADKLSVYLQQREENRCGVELSYLETTILGALAIRKGGGDAKK